MIYEKQYFRRGDPRGRPIYDNRCLIQGDRKGRHYSAIAVIALLTFLLTCSETPEYCGPGRQLNTHTEFCYEGEVYQKCGGKEYNPTAQFCHERTPYDRCGVNIYDPVREFCNSTVIYNRCGGRTFNPATQGCDRHSESVKPKCGRNLYDDVIEFCHGGNRVYELCNGQIFNPTNEECNGVKRLPRCGEGVEYNDSTHFCIDNVVHTKCGGAEFDPSTHGCNNGTVHEKCGGSFYNADTHFCFDNTLYSLCGGKDFNPITRECVDGAVRDKEGTLPADVAHILTVNASPAIGGTVTRQPNQPAYALGTQVSLTAIANSGFRFVGWAGAVSDTNQTVTVPMTSNQTVTANFIDTGTTTFGLTVNVDPAGSGTVSRNPDQARYAVGTSVSLTAVPAGGYRFVNWTMAPIGVVGTNSTFAVPMNGDRVVIATFETFDIDVDDINSIARDMVFVQGGNFTMGCTDEQFEDCWNMTAENPPHSVSLSDFYIGKYPVTNKQWRSVMNGHSTVSLRDPSNWKDDDLPVETVSWDDVQEFIRLLNDISRRDYRLPTEAEWEYAARGGTMSGGFKYSGSDDINEVAWFIGNSSSRTHPVGTKAPNELGIYDMSGNVWEWVNDRWESNYNSRSGGVINPQGPATGSFRVNRGGSWSFTAANSRVSNRSNPPPSYRHSGLGFRLAHCATSCTCGRNCQPLR